MELASNIRVHTKHMAKKDSNRVDSPATGAMHQHIPQDWIFCRQVDYGRVQIANNIFNYENFRYHF